MGILTKDIFRKIKEREKAATKGPWRWADYNCYFEEREIIERMLTLESHDAPRFPIVRRKSQNCRAIIEIDDPIFSQGDRDFLAYSRTDIPTLISGVEKLEDDIAEMERALEFYASGLQDNGIKAKTALRYDDVS